VGAELLTDRGRSLVVRSASRYRDRGLIVGFEGVDDRDQAEALLGSMVTIAASSRRPLDDGEYWPDDLVGLAAVSPDGSTLGVVIAVDFGAGQDRLVVSTPAGAEVLVPFVDGLVGEPAGGRIEIRDPGGLFRP
jgi:16S rRNA processing protein RimM